MRFISITSVLLIRMLTGGLIIIDSRQVRSVRPHDKNKRNHCARININRIHLPRSFGEITRYSYLAHGIGIPPFLKQENNLQEMSKRTLKLMYIYIKWVFKSKKKMVSITFDHCSCGKLLKKYLNFFNKKNE